jgi:hypothetical protein
MLEFETTYPILRVYFNQKEDYPLVWSVDDGSQQNEFNVPSVVVQGVGYTRYLAMPKSEDCPAAWLEFHEARLHRIDGAQDVFIDNSSD